MSPAIFSGNGTNRCDSNSIPIRKCLGVFPWLMLRPYNGYLRLRKLAQRVLLAFKFVRPVLCNHVGAIILRCSQKKMRRINASRVVAFMENQKIVWNFSVSENPRKSMRSDGFPFMPKSPISPVVERPNPIPAIGLGFVYVLKEAGDRLFLRSWSAFNSFRLHNNNLRLLLCHVPDCYKQCGGTSFTLPNFLHLTSTKGGFYQFA